jgi:hypothetical protein
MNNDLLKIDPKVIERLRIRTHLRAGDVAPIGTTTKPTTTPPVKTTK